MNKADKHYGQSEQAENSLNQRAAQPQESVEDAVARRVEVEALHKAIAQLPEKQRHRLVLYYFGDFTYQQIAEMEGCTIMPVKRCARMICAKSHLEARGPRPIGCGPWGFKL